MNIRKTIFVLFAFFTSFQLSAQFTQTVRGTVLDFDMKVPIPEVKIVLTSLTPIQGVISDQQGEFRFDNIPVGRVDIRISAFGYQEIIMNNVLLESGKEKLLFIEMQPDVQNIETIEVKSQKDKSEAINKMATVSSKTFTVEETNRYSGSLNDPARMVTGFAGVVGNSDGDNDIVVRGNSPRGILWRLEGIDIPNPNHFSGEGSTGGPVSSLNGSMLGNSDFFSGAFAPEYGNALSGVFDVQFRQGNNEKREYSFSAGVIGIDATLEGPIKKDYKGSYLINYRYSSIALLTGLGLLDFDGIPKYQDVSFKFFLPTKKIGNFSIVGLGGLSNIDQTDQDDSTKYIYGSYLFKAGLGVGAIKHTIVLSPKVYVKSYLSVSTAFNGGEGRQPGKSGELYIFNKEKFTDNKAKVQSIVNYKMNNKNLFQIGATYTKMDYRFLFQEDELETGFFTSKIKSNGQADLLESFVSWKYRVNNDLFIVSGFHHTQLFLNNNYAVEPRIGMKWQQSSRSDFSLGFGLHSRMESISTYQYNWLQPDGNYFYPNKNLDFSKSAHYVLGYGFKVNENLRLKTEVYYQKLFNLPVENDVNSSFSLSNSNGGIPDVELVNKGTGRNYGLELTGERYFNNNFYYLVTASIYKSKYTALDGIERDSRYDANYAFNVLGGKEFNFGKGKNKTIGFNAKASLLGGNRYTPIDLQASILAQEEVQIEKMAYQAKGDDIFVLNFGITYRVNMLRASHSFKIDIQNITNNKGEVYRYYNARTKQIETGTQLPLIPNLIYTIKF
jgi:hypothetical protein